MKKLAALIAGAAVLIVAAGVASASPAKTTTMSDKNIVETAVAAGQFKTLATLVAKAGLAETLATGGTFTVFAPTDEAFAKVPQATLDALAANPDLLKSVLLYHVVPGKVPAADVVKLSSAKTLEGRSVSIKVVDGSVYIDQAKVTTPDIMASNGVIHVIDSVLIPKAETAEPSKNIVQTATAAGQFKTLVSLVKKAGLAGALQGKGPFTVFAPTNAAFAKVPKATLAALAKDKAKLKAVLLYHVAKGKVTSGQVVKLKSVKTLQGGAVSIKVTGGKVYVGGARVITPDVMASNGVIHVINKVLIPAS
jgi:uncharacterized surface protein with fasciclin (FAS1) repeats